MQPRLIRRAELVITPWRNGAGRKSDIATGPGWLAGFAFLDQDAPFSEYPDVDRTITLIEGPGFVLDFGEAVPALVVSAPFEPRAFDGGLPTQCRIAGGPCVVLNAISERTDWTHSVTIDPPLDEPIGPGIAIVLRGEVALGTDIAGFRDAWQLSEQTRMQPSPDAMVAFIHFSPRTP